MSKKTIELGEYDAAITFRQDLGTEFDICENMLIDDYVTENIVIALALFYLLQRPTPEFTDFLEKAKQEIINRFTESHGKRSNTKVH